MQKYHATIATDWPMEYGDHLSKELLEQLAKQAPGLPITLNFNHIPLGKVETASVTDNGVETTCSIIPKELPEDLSEQLYAVIGGIIKKSHMEGNIRVIDEMKLTEISLTTIPADTHLTPIKKE